MIHTYAAADNKQCYKHSQPLDGALITLRFNRLGGIIKASCRDRLTNCFKNPVTFRSSVNIWANQRRDHLLLQRNNKPTNLESLSNADAETSTFRFRWNDSQHTRWVFHFTCWCRLSPNKAFWQARFNACLYHDNRFYLLVKQYFLPCMHLDALSCVACVYR